jgi:hypothetical protein
MKKFVIATTIALLATAASALEVGVNTSHTFSGGDRNAVGVTIGQKLGGLGVAVGFDRTQVGANDQTRYSVVAGYDVIKLGPVAVGSKLGAAYLANQIGSDGYAVVAGVGTTLALTKTVAATVDFTRQYGQDRVASFNGNRLTAGVKYSF